MKRPFGSGEKLASFATQLEPRFFFFNLNNNNNNNNNKQAIAPLLNFIDPDDASDGGGGSSLLSSIAAGKWPTLESVVGGGGSSSSLSLLSYRVPLPPTPVPELAPFVKRHAAALDAYAARRTAEIAAESDNGGAAGLGPRLGLRRSSRATMTSTTANSEPGNGQQQSGSVIINVPEPGEGLLRAEREIPSVFFREEFDLSSQEAWSSLLGIANSVPPPSSSSEPSETAAAASPSPKTVLASAADPKLRELAADRAARLACLADGALVDEVAARAPIFGAAAATLGGLRGDVAAVAALAREDEAALSAAAARAKASAESAELLALRRRNLRAALAALEPLETARDAREALSAALSLGDFNGSLLALEALRGASAAFGVVDRGDINSASSVPVVVAALAEDIQAAETGVKRLLKGAAARALHLLSSSSTSSSGSTSSSSSSSSSSSVPSPGLRGSQGHRLRRRARALPPGGDGGRRRGRGRRGQGRRGERRRSGFARRRRRRSSRRRERKRRRSPGRGPPLVARRRVFVRAGAGGRGQGARRRPEARAQLQGGAAPGSGRGGSRGGGREQR